MTRDSSPTAMRVPWRPPTARILLLVFVAAAIVVGGLLRFAWLSDMEYKSDERWSFDRSQRVGSVEPWPALGMPSSVGLRNPGLSIWIFVMLAKAFAIHHPVALDRAVVTCSVSAFVLLFAFVVRTIPSVEREPWLWGLALAAVNPTAVLLERKIWPPSVFPIFCAAFLIGWMRRERGWGAFTWGLVGALLGQIQMGGFFFTAGFALWELCVGRLRYRRGKRARWVAWLAGTALGAVTLVPWARYAWTAPRGSAFAWSHMTWSQVTSFRFYRLWLSDALGLGLDYSLGGQYLDFLRYPIVGAADTYPALYLQGLSFSVGVYVAACAGRMLWRARRRWRSAPSALGRASEAAHAGAAALVGYGVLLTATGLNVWRHYMIITFPLEWTTLACVALASVRRPHRWLAVLWTAELGLSLAFLDYIHHQHGAVQGDYGRAFRWQ